MIARTCNDVQSTDRCNGDRSLCPIDAMRNNRAREGIPGHGFPDGTLSETAPHYSGEFRDAVSRWGLLGKLHPTPKRQNGTGFPTEVSSGNCVPESAAETGRSFRTESTAMLRNNGRAFALSMRTEGNAPGIRAGADRGESAHVLPKLRVEGRGRDQVLPRVRRARRRRM